MHVKTRKKLFDGRAIKALTMALALAGSIGGFTAQARTLNVQKPSEEAIREAVKGIDLSEQVTYAKNPNTTPGSYDPGELSEQTQKDAIATLNVARYIAGIPSNVTADDTYVGYAQAGALLNYAHGIIEHKPAPPTGMTTELYNKGYKGTSEGNLHSSSASSMSMNSAIISGWLADSGDNNLGTVGHRRWCLNPSMGKTGFGAVTGADGSFACMYAFDGANTTTSYDTVVWPAQTMPTEYFGSAYPWSISSNTDFSSDTSITLTRQRDGRVWNFSSSSADGHFTINNAGYGMHGCVIFRPSGVGGYQDGDTFDVVVKEGGKTTLSYSVRFFSQNKVADTAKISLWSNIIGLGVGAGTSNQITITDPTDSDVSSDKVMITVEDENIASAKISTGDSEGKEVLYLNITGKKEGETKITVSLANGSSASCVVTVVPSGHMHDYSQTIVVREATCYLIGLRAQNICECGARSGNTIFWQIPTTGHTLERDAAKTATCTEDGLTEGSHCSVCGEVVEAQTVIAATGHTEVVDEAVEATCSEEGLTEGSHCSVCGEVLKVQEKLPMLDHVSVEDEEIPATCTEPGKTEGSHCSVCGRILKEQEEIPALDYEEVADEEVPATCTQEGRTAGSHCNRCGKTLSGREVIEKLAHTAVTDEAVEATCTEKGLTEGSHCSTCGQVLKKQEETPALGHKEVADKAVPATCTEAGKTAGSHCSVCGNVLVEQTIIEAPGHAVVEDEAVEPTCTESGKTAGRHCSTCGQVLKKQEEILALGHEEVTDEEVPATCTQEGRTAGSHCNRCEKTFSGREVIEKLAHTAVTDEAVEATCTEKGLTEGSHCSTCGQVLKKQEETPALGHKEVADKAVPATCTEAGKTAGSHCSVCGNVLVEQTIIEAPGHAVVEDEAVEPTCTESGKTAGRHCSTCDQVLKKQEEILALGHEEVTDEEVPATCTQEGRTAGSHCTRCGKTLSGREVIEKLPHTPVIAPAVEATYESTGLTEGSHCSVCGAIIVAQQVTPKLVRPAAPTVSDTPTIPVTPVAPVAPVSAATGVKLSDAKTGGNYKVTAAGASGTATVEYTAPTNKNAATVKVPDTMTINNVTYKVTSIAPNAFKNSKKLKKVTIGSNITTIGANAFSGCKKLTSVTLGANVATINTKAFYNCTTLKKVTIPANVSRIDKQAFAGCKKLKTITIKTTKLTTKNVGAKAFKGIYSKATIKVPKKSLSAYKKLLKKKGVSSKAKIKK